MKIKIVFVRNKLSEWFAFILNKTIRFMDDQRIICLEISELDFFSEYPILDILTGLKLYSHWDYAA